MFSCFLPNCCVLVYVCVVVVHLLLFFLLLVVSSYLQRGFVVFSSAVVVVVVHCHPLLLCSSAVVVVRCHPLLFCSSLMLCCFLCVLLLLHLLPPSCCFSTAFSQTFLLYPVGSRCACFSCFLVVPYCFLSQPDQLLLLGGILSSSLLLLTGFCWFVIALVVLSLLCWLKL